MVDGLHFAPFANLLDNLPDRHDDVAVSFA
jgi:hypothetical protein